jgi:hypothetical protein
VLNIHGNRIAVPDISLNTQAFFFCCDAYSKYDALSGMFRIVFYGAGMRLDLSGSGKDHWYPFMNTVIYIRVP